MKLIIDIPEGTYKAVELGTINQVLEYKVWNAIKNCTPLDDVKAEIDNLDRHKEKYSYAFNRPDLIDSVLNDVLQILYDIGKVESEE